MKTIFRQITNTKDKIHIKYVEYTFFKILNHLLIHHLALFVVLVKHEFGFCCVLQQSKAENMKLSFK